MAGRRRRAADLRVAAALHDIGKVGVPDAILQKQGTLSPDERRVVEAHTTIGHEILEGSGNPVLDLAATVALTHHERFDGTGYPRGLKEKRSPSPVGSLPWRTSSTR